MTIKHDFKQRFLLGFGLLQNKTVMFMLSKVFV